MKNILRRTARIFFRSLLVFIAVVVLYGLCAVILSRIPVNRDFVQASEGVTIFVESNGVHTDIVVPAKNVLMDWTQQLPYTDFASADSAYRYIAFGWGDKGFYIDTPAWSDLRFSTAFKAIFHLGTTAMHVTYKKLEPYSKERSRKLVITEEQYRALIEYIRKSFERDASGHVQLIDHAGYTAHDRFYEAEGTYSFVKTCNVWTGDGLKAAGVRIGVWTPFEGGVLRAGE